MDQSVTLRILKLSIIDCLGCSQTNLTFSDMENVHLLIYQRDDSNEVDVASISPSNTSVVTPVAQAMQLLCTMAYPNARSLQRLPLLKIGRGSVSLTFQISRCIPETEADVASDDIELDMEPCTSRQALQRERERQQRRRQRQQERSMQLNVTVVRRFDDVLAMDKVMIQVNNGEPLQKTLAEFHKMFFVASQHSHDFLRDMHNSCAGNWLRVIHADADSYGCLKAQGNPFETFAKLFERKAYSPMDFMHKLATQCLAANEVARLAERSFLLKVFNNVSRLFEHLTASEYSVLFFVPRLNRYEPLEQVTVEDFDLSDVHTTIKRVNDNSRYFWHNADHNIKDLLLVAFQLALAYNANQTVLFISQLEKLNEFTSMQYVTAAFMNRARDEGTPEWICHKYLQRIIELCMELGILVFIEYPSALTLLKANHPVFKCKQLVDKDTGDISWSVYADVTKDNCGVEHLTEAIDSKYPK